MNKQPRFFGNQNGRVLAIMIICVLVLVFLIQRQGMQTQSPTVPSAENPLPTTKGQIREVKIKDKVFEVEVMSTGAQIQRGLSGRTEIGADAMLFVFPMKARYTFWMKEMMFNLDFLWIDTGKVVQIMENIPKPPTPDTPNEQLLHYQPNVPVNMVLEIPAGFVKNYQIQVGDEVRILE